MLVIENAGYDIVLKAAVLHSHLPLYQEFLLLV